MGAWIMRGLEGSSGASITGREECREEERRRRWGAEPAEDGGVDHGVLSGREESSKSRS